MSEHTINVNYEDYLSMEAEQAGLTPDLWIEQYVNGHLSLLAPNYDSYLKAKDKAAYDAKVANWQKVEALKTEERAIVDKLIAGEMTAADVEVKPAG